MGKKKVDGSGGIRTHAPEETGALNQRLGPLGHATVHTFRVQLVFLLLAKSKKKKKVQ